MAYLPFAVPLLGAFISLTTASPVSTSAHLEAVSRSQQGIVWEPCNITDLNPDAVAVAAPGFQCATLQVPLDYADNKNDQELTLSLIKVPATKKPAHGKTKSILFNFGGPGMEARSTLLSSSSLLLLETGGIYDLVAFDPRGTANTIPATCADDLFTDYLQLQNGMTVNDNSTTTLDRLWTSAQAVANRCAEQNQKTKLLDKISTPAVARDMMSVVDALQEDGLLRYWGLSYGTTLGATLLAMFPDKVEKLILDGVQNPHQYYNDLVNSEEFIDADKQFSAIFPACVENPDACALAQRSPKATAKELEDQVWQLIDHVKTEPLVYGSQVIDYTTLMGTVAEASYNYYNNQLTNLTAAFALYLNLAEHKEVPPPPPSEPSTKTATLGQVPTLMGLIGIQCLDRNKRLPPGSTLKDFLPSSMQLYASSRVMASASLFESMVCANWKIDPSERFNSDFKVKPRKPVLILGNTFDGHTPLKSAYGVSSTVENSAVLEIDGYAHSSVNVASSCALSTISDYWVNGTVPKNGTHCKSESKLFSNITWADVIPKFTSKSQRSLPLNV